MLPPNSDLPTLSTETQWNIKIIEPVWRCSPDLGVGKGKKIVVFYFLEFIFVFGPSSCVERKRDHAALHFIL